MTDRDSLDAERTRMMSQWRLSDAAFVAETPRAFVWKVTTSDGAPAALKIAAGPDKASEALASTLLRYWDGDGAVRLLAESPRAWLLEWLDGPSLGDLSRAGHDREATEHLVSVARALHPGPTGARQGLPDMASWSTALARYAPDTAPSAADAQRIAAAQDLLAHLLATAGIPRPLHGDLHHDNVLSSARGWLAFDPKGVWGELSYETATAFLNPVGASDLAAAPARIDQMADAFADGLGLDRARVLRWAAAHCALSIAWSEADGEDCARVWAMLPALLEAAGA